MIHLKFSLDYLSIILPTYLLIFYLLIYVLT
jgi:hypothetical protein